MSNSVYTVRHYLQQQLCVVAVSVWCFHGLACTFASLIISVIQPGDPRSMFSSCDHPLHMSRDWKCFNEFMVRPDPTICRNHAKSTNGVTYCMPFSILVVVCEPSKTCRIKLQEQICLLKTRATSIWVFKTQIQHPVPEAESHCRQRARLSSRT